MPEITKCSGVFCQVRESCYRYTAPPSARQMWCAFYAADSFKRETGCDHMWRLFPCGEDIGK